VKQRLRAGSTFLGLALSLLFLCLCFCGSAAWAQDFHLPTFPDIKIVPQKIVGLPPTLQLMFFTTSLGLLPYLLVTATAYIRVSITFSYLKAALGSPQGLSNQISQGIIIFVTLFIMYPVVNRIHDRAVAPYLAGKIEKAEFGRELVGPFREFMMKQTRDEDLYTFDRLGGFKSRKRDDVPMLALYPAFITSEVKTGFMIGFMIYIPFLVVDMVVAATMMSMGMFQISPMQIALPFKLLLFCSIEGWHIYIVGLRKSFNFPKWYPH
jgi:flagellar biosynthetic protein FliP